MTKKHSKQKELDIIPVLDDVVSLGNEPKTTENTPISAQSTASSLKHDKLLDEDTDMPSEAAEHEQTSVPPLALDDSPLDGICQQIDKLIDEKLTTARTELQLEIQNILKKHLK